LDLASAIEAEPQRREGRRLPPNVAPASLMYTEIGSFAKHVERWRQAFGGERVHVVRLEDLRSRPCETCARLLRWLELEPVGGHFPHLNPARRTTGAA